MAQGCYTEPYLPASYKGIGFKALESTSEHGRRGAEGEFPFGETTAYADLGRRIRKYTIRARFDGNNHVQQSALLIAACELRGSGPLVHPTRGVIVSAACVRLKVTDKPDEEQGVTYVDLDFVEANNWPNGLSLVGSILGIVVGPLLTQARASFSSRFAPTTVQPLRQAAVIDAAQAQVANIANQYAAATITEAASESRNQVLIELQRVATVDSAATTVNVDRAIALGMTAIAQATTGQAKYDVMRDLANGAALSSTFAAPASTSENAVYNLVRTVAAVYMSQGAVEVADTRTDEIFVRADAVDAVLQDELAYARGVRDNPLYLAIEDFRRDSNSQLLSAAFSAPGLIEFDFNGAVHPLTAAYNIYGDARRLRDVENLNGVGRLGRVGPTVIGERVVG